MNDFKYQITSGAAPLWAENKQFVNRVDINTICENRDFAIKLASTDFLDTIIEVIRKIHNPEKIQIKGFMPNEYIIIVDDPLFPAQISITFGGHGYADEEDRHNFQVYALGTRTFVFAFFQELKNIYGNARLATVSWWFRGQQGINCRIVPIEPPLPLYDEFYPLITEGVENYLDRYMTDSAPILFLMGPPGTGKTSLLRHMIYSRILNATITYDESILGSDEMFISFLCDRRNSILIVEDADLLVGSRESEGNKLISRFLNVSDGLIKTSGKKIVFTTNQGDFRNVDEALIRSGRCFDAIKFRPLTWEEAKAAAKVASIDLPKEQKEITLADLFSTRKHNPVELAKIGI